MAGQQKNILGGGEAAHCENREDRPANVAEFLRRAPQFNALVDAVEGRERELSPSQRDCLDDFAVKLAEGAAEGDDAA